MHWIKEVEMVGSEDDLRSLSSVRGIRMPDFEALDARIASALTRIIHNSLFKKKKVSLEEQKAPKEDRFLRGRQIAYLIYEYFWATEANDSVENYADLLTIVLRNDDIQEFDSKWDGILSSTTQIPSDGILESLYIFRIRESEKLKTVLELYNFKIHLKKAGPDYHRLKTMVKRSIEQNFRVQNFEARNGKLIDKRRGQESGDKTAWTKNLLQEIVGSGKPTGSVLKETIAVSVTISISVQKQHSRILLRALLRGRLREMHREPEVLEAEVQVEECFDCPARVTSKELAPIHSVKNGNLQNAYSTRPRVVAGLERSAHSQTFETKILRSDLFSPGDPHQRKRNPNAPKICGSVSGRDGMARAMCPRSSVEAGEKHPKIKGEN